MTDILILDDNTSLTTMLRLGLERRGFVVADGYNGNDGIQILEAAARNPDLILSNLYMPQMDGLTFLKHIRAHPDWSAIPFVLMSAAPTEDHRRAALANAVQGILQKPFTFDQLDALLDELGIAP
jgi:two-component system chemotaxis response regulator CheY